MAWFAWLWIGLALASPEAVPIHGDGAATAANALASHALEWPGSPSAIAPGHRSRSSDRPGSRLEACPLLEEGEDDESSAPRAAFLALGIGGFDPLDPWHTRPLTPPRSPRRFGAQRSPILRC